MQAYRLLAKGKAASLDTPRPALRPEYLLVKVDCVALNPTDWKNIKDTTPKVPLTVGCDFASTVEEVGSAVTGSFRPGERICGSTNGCNTFEPEDVAFTEYLVAKADLTLKIPDYMRSEEAASMGVQVYTIGQGLSGLEVITTCSPENFELVKSFGADKVLNYKSPTVSSDIRQYTNNKLRYVWDTIGDAKAAQICADALSSSSESNLKYTSIGFRELPFPRTDMKTDLTLAYTALNERIDMLGRFILEPQLEDFEFAKKWKAIFVKLLEENKVVSHPVEVRKGLENIVGGLTDLEEGRVRAKKLVYRISDL